MRDYLEPFGEVDVRTRWPVWRRPIAAGLLVMLLGLGAGGCGETDGDACAGIPCGSHGRCRVVGGSATCECETGYHPVGLLCVSDEVNGDGGGTASCGNDAAETGEMCDGQDLRGETCESLGFEGGTLGCKASCSYYDTRSCWTLCGDHLMGGTEECDDQDFGGETCTSLGFYGGQLACNADCTLDTSGCGGACGDGVVQEGEPALEECDGAELGGETCASLGFYGGQLACGSDCRFDTSGCAGYCGDGVMQSAPPGSEVCDGDDLGGLSCESLGYDGGVLGCAPGCDAYDTSGCTGTPHQCGDGVVDLAAGEVCDDGANDGSYGGCMPGCAAFAPRCGDNQIDANYGEVCDGTALGGRSCQDAGYYGGQLACAAGCDAFDETGCAGFCGDATLDGTEVCDDGVNDGSYGGCMPGCGALAPHCGDGVRNGAEACDGADFGGDTCASLGQPPAGALACDATCQVDTSACHSDPGLIAPGQPFVAPVSCVRFHDIRRLPSGTLLVGCDSGSGVGNPVIYRSTDGGASFTSVSLGNAGQNTYTPRIDLVDPGTVAVGATQGDGPPYDIHLKTTADEGVSFSASWVNLSNSNDLLANKHGMALKRLASDDYLAAFRHRRVYTRTSASLASWSSTTRVAVTSEMPAGERWGLPELLVDGATARLAVSSSEAELYVFSSTDDGGTWQPVSVTSVSELMHVLRLWQDPATATLYACGTTLRQDAVERVYTYRSTDGGATWDRETVYLYGLPRMINTTVSCHVDDTGVWVGYQDTNTSEVVIVPPGALAECGNGVKEPGEVCDGNDFGEITCLQLGFGGGSLVCQTDCQTVNTDNCTAPTDPPDCDAIAAQNPSAPDGDYTIDPDGSGPNPPFTVYCADMASGTPDEYLPLAVTGGSNNYSLYYRYTASETATCHYTKLRFDDVFALRIDRTDQRFATCTGNPTFFPSAVWARAGSCRCGGCAYGQMNVNLTGTPFKLDYAGGVGWETVGWIPAGGVTNDQGPGIVVDATGGGYCGDTLLVSPPGAVLTFQ